MSTARARAVEALKDALVDLWAAREVLNEDFSTPDEDYAEVKRIIREVRALTVRLVGA